MRRSPRHVPLSPTFRTIGMLTLLCTLALTQPVHGKKGGGGNNGGGEDPPPPPPTSEISYSIKFLNTLGGTVIAAYGMNGNGDVVGTSETQQIGDRTWQMAFLFDADTQTTLSLHKQFEDEGVLDELYGYPNMTFDYQTGSGWLVGSADDINDAGQIIGSVRRAVNGKGQESVEYRYTPGDGAEISPLLEELLPLPDGTFAIARAINSAGLVVGYSDSTDGLYHAVAWPPAGSGLLNLQVEPVDLGVLYDQDTIPNDVNDSGMLCGQLNGVSRAWRGDIDGIDDLGKLQKGKWGWSEARSINTRGDIAGTSTLDSVTTRVFLYTDQSGMQDLGTLGGSTSTGGYCNDAGDVVGTSRLAQDTEDHAFLYTDGTMIDLEDAVGGFSTSEYYGLLIPEGINNAGQIFGNTSTGTGLARRAFILTPN